MSELPPISEFESSKDDGKTPPRKFDANDSTTLPSPGEFFVIRRNQTTIPFNDEKIRRAIEKAFVAERSEEVLKSHRDQVEILQVKDAVVKTIRDRLPEGGYMHVEDIQDKVIAQLVRLHYSSIASRYANYRKERQLIRETNELVSATSYPEISVVKKDGNVVLLDWQKISTILGEACEGIPDIEYSDVFEGVKRNLYDRMPEEHVESSLRSAATDLIVREPNYSLVAARLLLSSVRTEVLDLLHIEIQGQPLRATEHKTLEEYYHLVFKAGIEKGVEAELLNPELLDFNLDLLGRSLRFERDLDFTYLGLQTLCDRYLLHVEDVRFELPQILFMRVAMGLALNETERNEKAIDFYEMLSSFRFVSSTPTLFNSGTTHSQLSSCYLTTVPDDLDGIFSAIKDNANLSKWAGGLGNDWTPVRSSQSRIKGTNGKSQGVVPFLKVVNDTAVAVNQGGKRKGAVCSYLETWHLDIREFLGLRKNTGDDHRQTLDMNTANWVPDLFMKRLDAGEHWTLFSPSDVPDLHDLYGPEFEQRYCEYERMTETGELKLFERLPAAELWRAMLTNLYETGHPWITFKDACNLRSPQQHVGVVHSSNLCTEITLNTSQDEIAVCNLGSLNLAEHVDSFGNLETEKLRDTVRTAIRMLDNVIDINFYAVNTAKNSNMKHRPIGLGIMGFQDALYKKRISYASQDAVEFADESMEAISYFAIESSSDLAETRGTYDSFEGSLWSRGILPIDSLKLLSDARGAKYTNVDYSTRLDWSPLREKVKNQGMRNSNVLAIAPTATIANIAGVTPSIEPPYENSYIKNNLSGNFLVVNRYLAADLKKIGLWNQKLIDGLKAENGSVANIEEVPQDIRDLYLTAFEIEPRWYVDAASRRQKWIDQSQSLNIYFASKRGEKGTGKKLSVLYQMAWRLGLKTTYYLRARSATKVEKSTIHDNRELNDVNPNVVQSQGVSQSGVAEGDASVTSNDAAAPDGNATKAGFDFNLDEPAAVPPACSIDDPDCEACQ